MAEAVYTNKAMWLVYRDDSGQYHYQPWEDLTECGTLTDGETDRDMDLVGWTTGNEG